PVGDLASPEPVLDDVRVRARWGRPALGDDASGARPRDVARDEGVRRARLVQPPAPLRPRASGMGHIPLVLPRHPIVLALRRRRILQAGSLIAVSYVIMVAFSSPFLIAAPRTAPTHQLRPPANASVDLLSFVVPRFSTLIGGRAVTGITANFTANVVEDGAYL